MGLFGPNFRKLEEQRDFKALVDLSLGRDEVNRKWANISLENLRKESSATHAVLMELDLRLKNILARLESWKDRERDDALDELEILVDRFREDYLELNSETRSKLVRKLLDFVLDELKGSPYYTAQTIFNWQPVSGDLETLKSSGCFDRLKEALAPAQDRTLRLKAADRVGRIAHWARLQSNESGTFPGHELLQEMGFIDILISFYEEQEDDDDRGSVLCALDELLYPGSFDKLVPLFLGILDDQDTQIRLTGFYTLNEMALSDWAHEHVSDPQALVEDILPLLGHEDREIKECAADTITRLIVGFDLKLEIEQQLFITLLFCLKNPRSGMDDDDWDVMDWEKLQYRLQDEIDLLLKGGKGKELIALELIETLVKLYSEAEEYQYELLLKAILNTLELLIKEGFEEEMRTRGGLKLLADARKDGWELDLPPETMTRLFGDGLEEQIIV